MDLTAGQSREVEPIGLPAPERLNDLGRTGLESVDSEVEEAGDAEDARAVKTDSFLLVGGAR